MHQSIRIPTNKRFLNASFKSNATKLGYKSAVIRIKALILHLNLKMFNRACEAPLMSKLPRPGGLAERIQRSTFVLSVHFTGAAADGAQAAQQTGEAMVTFTTQSWQTHRRTEGWMRTSCLFCLYGGCVSVSRSAMPKPNGERVARLNINAFSHSRYHSTRSC